MLLDAARTAALPLLLASFLAAPYWLGGPKIALSRAERIAGSWNAMFTLPLFSPAMLLAPRAGWILACLICTALGICQTFFVRTFGHFPNRNTWFLVCETNPEEALGFLRHFLRPKLATISVAGLGVWVLAVFALVPADPSRSSLVLAVASVAIAGSFGFDGIRQRFFARSRFRTDRIEVEWRQAVQNPLWSMFDSFRAYRAEKTAQEHLVEGLQADLPPATTPDDRDAELHILVLGESAVRSHMGLYGYRRPTTPGLSALRDELFVFDEVVSPHSATIACVRELFTHADAALGDDGAGKGTLFHWLRSAGFSTWWLSNQSPSGFNDNFAAMLGRTCDHHVFVNGTEHYMHGSLDEKLLAPLEAALADPAPRKFVVVHLMGQHFPFAARYPSEFARFDDPSEIADLRGDPSQIDAYDNATLYNDHILTRIVEMARDRGCPASMTYLSDHGLDLFEFNDSASQMESDGTRPMFEIPFVLWMSEGMRERRQKLTSTLDGFVHRKFITSDLIHTLPDLVGIEHPHRDVRRSLFSPDWTPRPRVIVDGERAIERRDFDTQIAVLADETQYRRDAIERMGVAGDRLWAHRCNHPRKLEESMAIFRGSEVDLVWHDQSGVFDVTHPPVPSIGFDLSRCLEILATDPDHMLWLDCKNLQADTAPRQLDAMLRLCDRHGVDISRLVVESQDVDALALFTRQGFKTSFYLPTPFLRSLDPASYAVSSPAQRQELASIRENALGGKCTGVSLDGSHAAFARIHLPEAAVVRTWLHLKSPYDHFRRQEILAHLASDERIRTVLVKHPSRFDRT